MTCFRMKNGETVHQWCKKNGVLYDSFWFRMEKGLSFEESIDGAKKAKGKGNSHPKYFYKGKPIASLCGGSGNALYNRVFKRIRNGNIVENALKLEGVI